MEVVTIVYLAYTGALEPLGQSQILPYLRGLAARDVKTTLITFEKTVDWADTERRRALTQDLRGYGIDWDPCLWRPSLAGKLLNVLQGAGRAYIAAHRTRASLVHARSHVATAMAAVAARTAGLPFLFDLRGEIAEEYADAGHWRRNGILYRLTRAVERILLRRAKGIVVLTRRLAESLTVPRSALVATIPCCVDRTVFRPVLSTKPAIFAEFPDRPVLVYSGSLGTWYLLDEMLSLFARTLLRHPDALFLVLSNGAAAAVDSAAARARVPRGQVHVRYVEHREVPAWLTWCRTGLSFISPSPSKRGSSPTKIAEYLACRLPIVGNAGVGDLDDFIEDEGVGVLTQGFGTAELDRAAQFIVGAAATPTVRARCAAVAEARFDLERIGVERYRQIYQRMLAS